MTPYNDRIRNGDYEDRKADEQKPAPAKLMSKVTGALKPGDSAEKK